jgi:Anti-sigma-K factor rskA/Putative zinc-finger
LSEDPDMPTAPHPPDGRCGDAAIYLLGMLDEREAKRFLEHAETCAVCRDELGALRPAVDVLPASVPQLPAPGHVKQRVMSVVRSEARGDARHSRARVSRDGRSRSRSGLWSRLLPSHGSRRPALALASVGLLAGGVAIGALSAAGGAASGGGATRVVSADVTIAGASAALHESAARDWLTAAGLPQPRAGRVYELWVKHPGGLPQPTSSLFSPTSAGAASASVPSGLGKGSVVMVTQEPAGGSALPTSAPVIVAHVG